MVIVQFIRLGISGVPIQYLIHRGFLERYWSSVCIRGPKKLAVRSAKGGKTGSSRIDEQIVDEQQDCLQE